MSNSTGSDVLYAIFFIGLIVASQLDQLGFFSSTSSAASTAVKDAAAHHAGKAASATPATPQVSFDDLAWLVSWPSLLFLLIMFGILIWVVFNNILESKQKGLEVRQQMLEMQLNRLQERTEDLDWLERGLNEERDGIKVLTAELHTHRKMLKVLKQMPSYQVEAAAIAVSEAVKDPNAARKMTESLKTSATSEPEWEQEGEMTDGN